MAATETTTLAARPREAAGSRAARRLRQTGRVPGVLYGEGSEPLAFDVDARELRNALAAGGAVLELTIEGQDPAAVVVKEHQRHPVRGASIHIDLFRVRLDRAIQATTVVHLEGAEEAPGAKQGGVLEQVVREINVEALPTAIPEYLPLDVSGMDIGHTLTIADLPAPDGVTLLDDPETVLATLTPPRLRVESDEEIEQETEVVGEGEARAEAAGAGAGASEEPSGESGE